MPNISRKQKKLLQNWHILVTSTVAVTYENNDCPTVPPEPISSKATSPESPNDSCNMDAVAQILKNRRTNSDTSSGNTLLDPSMKTAKAAVKELNIITANATARMPTEDLVTEKVEGANCVPTACDSNRLSTVELHQILSSGMDATLENLFGVDFDRTHNLPKDVVNAMSNHTRNSAPPEIKSRLRKSPINTSRNRDITTYPLPARRFRRHRRPVTPSLYIKNETPLIVGGTGSEFCQESSITTFSPALQPPLPCYLESNHASRSYISGGHSISSKYTIPSMAATRENGRPFSRFLAAVKRPPRSTSPAFSNKITDIGPWLSSTLPHGVHDNGHAVESPCIEPSHSLRRSLSSLFTSRSSKKNVSDGKLPTPSLSSSTTHSTARNGISPAWLKKKSSSQSIAILRRVPSELSEGNIAHEADPCRPHDPTSKRIVSSFSLPLPGLRRRETLGNSSRTQMGGQHVRGRVDDGLNGHAD